MKDFCVECGLPHPSVFVYTDDKGEERYVHDRCANTYTRRVLRPRVIEQAPPDPEPGFPGYEFMQQ